MKLIIPTLEFGHQGPEVANLQDALVALLERAAILPGEPDLRSRMLEAVRAERVDSSFGQNTANVVSFFQDERGLEGHGIVDEPTVNALNASLDELSLLEGPAAPQAHIVSGVVRRADGLPLANVPVRAFHEAGAAAIRLGEDRTDADGQYTVRYGHCPAVRPSPPRPGHQR